MRSACEARANKERAWAEEHQQLRARYEKKKPFLALHKSTKAGANAPGRRAEEVAEKRAACEAHVQGMRQEQLALVAALQQHADEKQKADDMQQPHETQKAQERREHAGGEGGGGCLLRWWGMEELGKEEEEDSQEAQMARLEALRLPDVLLEREVLSLLALLVQKYKY